MAKVTKTAPKRTANTSSKKKGFLGRSFNLQSRKVQFFVVIIIVAILGGGYYTYKSFAATATAMFLPSEFDQRWGKQVTELQQGAKKNKVVFEIWGNPYVQVGSATTPAYSKMGGLLSGQLGKTARFCMFARGVEGAVGINLHANGFGSANTITTTMFGTDYSYQCTQNFVITNQYAVNSYNITDLGWQKISGANTYRVGYVNFEIIN